MLGDLTMSSSSAKVKDGKEVTLTVSLRNSGDAAATVRMVVKDGGTEVGSASAVIVPANGSKTETFVVKLTGKGDHVLAVTVFRGTTQVEGLNATVTVKVEKEEDGPGFGPAAAIAALGAAVAVAAVVSRRRRRN